MRSSGPTLLALPAFRGLTRKIILLAIACFLFLLLTGIFAPRLAGQIVELLALQPSLAFKFVWQFVTWPFVPGGLLNLIFALLFLWFTGAALEDERGTRWFTELFFTSSIGGAVLATLLGLLLAHVIPSINIEVSVGLWPTSLALMLVYARLHADEPMTAYFIIRARAKYIAAGFLLFYLIVDLYTRQHFDALNTVCNCLVAWLFMQMAPRRGLQHGMSESWFGLRNRYYRAKRRRAAKKFQVYMRKQGKDVSIDSSGRYIGLDDDDPDDRRRMN